MGGAFQIGFGPYSDWFDFSDWFYRSGRSVPFFIGFTVPCHRPSAQGVLKKSGTAEQGLRKLMGVVNH
jgi:hypothetical protein